MSGKFIINNHTYLKLYNFDKTFFLCYFNSILPFRVIGDINYPDALDPSGGPYMEKNVFTINGFKLVNICWIPEEKKYFLEFKKYE